MSNKVALITGATGGIGTFIAKELASKNYNIIIHYNKNKEGAVNLQKDLKKYNVSCMTIKCDLKNEEEIKNMYNTIISKFQNIDILINNASLEIISEFDDKTFDSFDKVLKTNLIGPFLLSKLIGEKMYQNKYGKIINISSNNAINQYDTSTLEYDASKSALISLTHNLALKFAPYVNVNAIAPGWIMTEKVKMMNDRLDGMLEQEEKEKIFKNRFGYPEEVASLVSFLCSDKADYINNEVIKIDGGVR